MNTQLEYAYSIPQGWDMYNMILPGVPTIFYKDPKTHLLSPVGPDAALGDNRHYVELLKPKRNIEPIWDISCRSNTRYGYGEEIDMGEVVYEYLNIRDPDMVLHPFVEQHAFKEWERQRGIFWFIKRWKKGTASEADTVLYNGYYPRPKVGKLPYRVALYARNELIKVKICEAKASPVQNTGNIEADDLRRGITDEDVAKAKLMKCYPTPLTLFEFGSMPIPGYNWFNVSLDSTDQDGQNHEFKSPRVLDRLFETVTPTKEANDLIPVIMDLIQSENIAIDASFSKEWRMSVNYLIADAIVRRRITESDRAAAVRTLWDRMQHFEFTEEELFADLGREIYPPYGYHCHDEQHASDLGRYFFQAHLQDNLGVASSSLCKYNYLLGTFNEVRVKRRPDILDHIMVELNMFQDQIMTLRCEKGITFQKYLDYNDIKF